VEKLPDDHQQLKRVLFIGPAFYSYHEVIIKGIEKTLPATVDYFPQITPNKYLQRISEHVDLNAYFARHLQKRVEKGIRNIKYKYDYIFVIKGDIVNDDLMKRLKNEFPDALFIYYTWDSFVKYPQAERNLKYFGRKYSFDGNDCLKYPEVRYLPLFHNWKQPAHEKDSFAYDLLFVGNATFRRLDFLEKIQPQCDVYNIRVKYYLPISRKLFLYYKMTNRYGSLLKHFYFKRISLEEYFVLLSETKAVIDSEHPTQSGLTMRTIESLALNKKLITTNKNILKEPFYNPANIMVIDRSCPCIEPDFFKTGFEPDNRFWNNYSLETWLKTIFGLPVVKDSSRMGKVTSEALQQ
jgi:hypothetical protein